MFVFGGIALAVFAIPLMTDPMVFNWDAIIHGAGKEKLPPLIWATTGLLGIVCAAVPMQTLPRGLVAAVLGLAGSLVPMLVMGHLGDQWQLVLMAIGAVLLDPGPARSPRVHRVADRASDDHVRRDLHADSVPRARARPDSSVSSSRR